jgi:stage III sporulation protein AA
MCSGVKGIFTAHGSSLEDIKLNPNIKELIENNCFEKIIFLSDKKAKGEVERIY